MSEDSNSRSAAGQGSTGEMSRPSNLQRIAQKKNQVRNYPRTKKLEKLAVYSSCKVSALFVAVCVCLSNLPVDLDLLHFM